MAELARRLHYSFADYLAFEEASNTRHEYFDGEIYAMAGGTPEHAALAAAVITLLGAQLKGKPCRLYSSDLRIRVVQTGLVTYPDVTVVCGAPRTDPESPTTVVNPTLIVEVLSERTAEYDQGQKFNHYKQISTLKECVFVSHRTRAVDVHRRKGARWVQHRAEAGTTITLESIDCALAVDDLYDGLTLN